MAYLRYSFAVDGDRVAINEATQPSGIISMQSGYPSPYSLIPTNPLAKKVERTKFNQLMYLVTSEIRQYQQFGTPNFITSAENGGVDYAYDKGARMVEGGVLYESLIDSNTDARSVITSWIPVNAIGQGALGQCELRIDSGNLLLLPLKGNKLMIDGINYPVPAGGITLPITGASASTMYYIYAYMNGVTMTLERSATIYETDNNAGILVKTSDPSRTFVGWAKTNATPVWSIVRTYYNDTSSPTDARAVLVFNGLTATPIYTQGDISVTAIGTGENTINVNMADANYGFTATAQPPIGTSSVVIQEKTNTTKTAGQFQISAYVNTATPTLVDCPVITVAVYGKRLGD
jgi:hypothetical protein